MKTLQGVYKGITCTIVLMYICRVNAELHSRNETGNRTVIPDITIKKEDVKVFLMIAHLINQPEKDSKNSNMFDLPKKRAEATTNSAERNFGSPKNSPRISSIPESEFSNAAGGNPFLTSVYEGPNNDPPGNFQSRYFDFEGTSESVMQQPWSEKQQKVKNKSLNHPINNSENKQEGKENQEVCPVFTEHDKVLCEFLWNLLHLIIKPQKLSQKVDCILEVSTTQWNENQYKKQRSDNFQQWNDYDYIPQYNKNEHAWSGRGSANEQAPYFNKMNMHGVAEAALMSRPPILTNTQTNEYRKRFLKMEKNRWMLSVSQRFEPRNFPNFLLKSEAEIDSEKEETFSKETGTEPVPNTFEFEYPDQIVNGESSRIQEDILHPQAYDEEILIIDGHNYNDAGIQNVQNLNYDAIYESTMSNPSFAGNIGLNEPENYQYSKFRRKRGFAQANKNVRQPTQANIFEPRRSQTFFRVNKIKKSRQPPNQNFEEVLIENQYSNEHNKICLTLSKEDEATCQFIWKKLEQFVKLYVSSKVIDCSFGIPAQMRNSTDNKNSETASGGKSFTDQGLEHETESEDTEIVSVNEPETATEPMKNRVVNPRVKLYPMKTGPEIGSGLNGESASPAEAAVSEPGMDSGSVQQIDTEALPEPKLFTEPQKSVETTISPAHNIDEETKDDPLEESVRKNKNYDILPNNIDQYTENQQNAVHRSHYDYEDDYEDSKIKMNPETKISENLLLDSEIPNVTANKGSDRPTNNIDQYTENQQYEMGKALNDCADDYKDSEIPTGRANKIYDIPPNNNDQYIENQLYEISKGNYDYEDGYEDSETKTNPETKISENLPSDPKIYSERANPMYYRPPDKLAQYIGGQHDSDSSVHYIYEEGLRDELGIKPIDENVMEQSSYTEPDSRTRSDINSMKNNENEHKEIENNVIAKAEADKNIVTEQENSSSMKPEVKQKTDCENSNAGKTLHSQVRQSSVLGTPSEQQSEFEPESAVEEGEEPNEELKREETDISENPGSNKKVNSEVEFMTGQEAEPGMETKVSLEDNPVTGPEAESEPEMGEETGSVNQVYAENEPFEQPAQELLDNQVTMPINKTNANLNLKNDTKSRVKSVEIPIEEKGGKQKNNNKSKRKEKSKEEPVATSSTMPRKKVMKKKSRKTKIKQESTESTKQGKLSQEVLLAVPAVQIMKNSGTNLKNSNEENKLMQDQNDDMEVQYENSKNLDDPGNYDSKDKYRIYPAAVSLAESADDLGTPILNLQMAQNQETRDQNPEFGSIREYDYDPKHYLY